MKYFIFKGNKSELDEILKDNVISKKMRMKLISQNHLIIGLVSDEQTESYMVIKFGDYLTTACKDRSPVIFKDYWPKDYKDIK